MKNNTTDNLLLSCNKTGLPFIWRLLPVIIALIAVFVTPAMYAQSKAYGTIQGRVRNAAMDQSLSNAEVTVKGTNISVLTDDVGFYSLNRVPVGKVDLVAKFQGLDNLTIPVTVEADVLVTQDFNFLGTNVTGDKTVVMDAYKVETKRFKSAQDLAMNVERNSITLKDVVSTDAMGLNPMGNVGEFVKYIPGVEAEYGSSDAFSGAGMGGMNPTATSMINVRGFGAADTAITIDGVPVSSVGPASLTSAISLDMLSVNNAARVEVNKVPTPEMASISAGGTVNLVTKSAFEYSRPTVTANLSFNFNTDDGNVFQKQPGPANKATYHTLPNANVSVAVPVTKTFGFTVSAATANNYSSNYSVKSSWQSTYSTQYGTTRAPTAIPYPDSWNYAYLSTWTTKRNATEATTYYNAGNLANGQLSTLTNPFLRQVSDQQAPWTENRISGSLKLDWRPFPWFKATGSYQIASYEGVNVSRRLQVNIYGPMAWDGDYVLGRPYEAATAGNNNKALDPGNGLNEEVTSRDKSGLTQTGYIKLEFNKGPFQIDGVASMSKTRMNLDDFANGHMYNLKMKASVGQVIMSNISDGTPSYETINIYDRSGNVFDYRNLQKWSIDGVDVGTAKAQADNTVQDYALNARWSLDFLPFKMAIKAGGGFRQEDQEKSGMGTGYKMRYTGPTDSNFISSITDTDFTRKTGIGFALNQQWADVYRMYDIYQQHPELFNPDYDVTYSIGNYSTEIGQVRQITMKKKRWYAQLEGSFLHGRISYVGGVRQENSERSGRQPASYGSWNYIVGPDGKRYRDSVYKNGVMTNSLKPGTGMVALPNGFLSDTALLGRLNAAGIAYPDHLMLSQIAGETGKDGSTKNNLEAIKKNLYIADFTSSQTGDINPMIALSIKLLDNLYFKPSWSHENQQPSLDGGGGGSLLGTFTINERETPTGNIGGDGDIKISNPELKPKNVDSWNFQLAWYPKFGQLSATYYYKTISNDWITNDIVNTDPDFNAILQSIGLSPDAYSNWTINTTENSGGSGSASGYELAGRLNFGFLGSFMSHFDAFGNYSHKEKKQSEKPGVVQMTNFAGNTWAAGLSVGFWRITAAARLNYTDAIWTDTGSPVNYGKNADGTDRKIRMYRVYPEVYRLDLDLNFKLTKHFNLYASAKNVTQVRSMSELHDAAGLLPTYAQPNEYYVFPRVIIVGVGATF